MKKIFFLFTLTIIFTAFVFPQTMVSLPDVTATPNTDVSIPVNVKNFNNVGAINLVINYDPNVLTFQSNPDPITGTFIINDVNTATGKQIRIAWFSLTPLNVADGALLHLNFNYIGGSSNIEFDASGNQIADANAVVIPTTFTNGSISPEGVTSTGSIGDYVWNDLDKNGLQEVATVEPPLENVTVKLFDLSTDPDATGSPLQTTTTNSAGVYQFSNLPAGTYKVKFELLNGYEFSPKKVDYPTSKDGDSDADMTSGLSDAITLIADQQIYGIDAGMYKPTTPPSVGSIGDFVWNDTNKDGIQDNTESGIKDVVVKLLDASNSDAELESTTTDAQGKYSFGNLSAGSYKVLFVLPTDYNFSPKNAASSTGDTDSDVNPTNGKTDVITLNAGDDLTNIDAGMNYIAPPPPPTQTASIGDYVWNDLDKNGIQRDKTLEPPLENVTVKLFDATVDPNGTGAPLQTKIGRAHV